MKTTDKKKVITQSWNETYGKFVSEVAKRESSSERSIKDAFSEKIKTALKGKDLIIENSCRFS